MGDRTTEERVADIARRLLSDGRLHIPLESGDRQAAVDAGWAARKAGRLLGRAVRITMVRTESDGGLVLTAVLVDP